jgi:iron complex transport system substrate-binding protein
MDVWPQRIVCLSEETTETLYLLGEQQRIVGISGFTVRPAAARRDKPKVAAFTSAKIDRILDLEPDLVLGFSDLQADIAATLVRAGIAVHVFNQRDIAGILAMIRTVGALVGSGERAQGLAHDLAERVERMRRETASRAHRPRVYFEEWDDPHICGIGWVSELIAVAGGEDCFADYARAGDARGRILEDPAVVVERHPDVIIGSWCGKRFRPEHVAARPGWARIPAVANGHLYEVKSPLILQPGPAALTDGLDALRGCIDSARDSGDAVV